MRQRVTAYKAHPIPGVAKSVCTAEQKIAYNLAFSAYINFDLATPEGIAAAIDASIAGLARNPKTKRYNTALIECLILENMESFAAAKYKILASFAEIGQAFPLSVASVID